MPLRSIERAHRLGANDTVDLCAVVSLEPADGISSRAVEGVALRQGRLRASGVQLPSKQANLLP